MRRALLALLLVLAAASPAVASETQVDPHATDVRLASQSGQARHYVWTAAGATGPHRLLVFLGGSDSKPGYYERFGARAAAHGFDVVDLRYPNPLVARQCPPSLGAAEQDACFARVRSATLLGGGDVAVADSVVSRLVALLQHLGWERYLIADPGSPYGSPPRAPDWSQIAIAGHSQGAGLSLLAARRFAVAGAALLSGPTDTVDGAPASWLSGPSATPPARIAALRADGEGAFCAGCDADWAHAGITRTTVTTVRPRSCVSRTCPALTEHDSTAVDSAVALDARGDPVLGPVWDAMLPTAAAPPVPAAITGLHRVRAGYAGRVTGACRSHRRVILRRAAHGRTRYAAATTDAGGRFTLHRRHLRGRVHVVLVATPACAGAASRPIGG